MAAKKKVPRKKTVARKSTRTLYEVTCDWCGELFWAAHPTRAKYCSPRCKMAAHRAKK